MKRQNSNLIQNYTDSDLQSFTILGNFKNYRSDSIEIKINRTSISLFVIPSLTISTFRNL